MGDLERLADLIRAKSAVEAEISALIRRPALIGHAGEYIAAVVFDIELHRSASFKGSDGQFRSGPLTGRTVNVKWYGLNESVVDINASAQCDDYLVLTGPRSSSLSSRGGIRPWAIESVYLFDCAELIAHLATTGVKIGIATGVRKHIWEAAEIYPAANNPRLALTELQRRQLRLFGSTRPAD